CKQDRIVLRCACLDEQDDASYFNFMATKDHDAVIILKRRPSVAVGALFERNPYFRVCSPNRPARAACPLDNDIEIRRDSVRR
ncbi:MAG: hypothetical protein WB475_00070, partial [Pseudolabrys sp.]